MAQSGVKETAQQTADTSGEILTLFVKKDCREIEELGHPCCIGSAGSPTPLTRADHHNHRNSQTTPSFCAYCREGLDALGTPLGTMQSLLGHSTPDIYLHAIPEEQRRAAESGEKLVFGAKWTQVQAPAQTASTRVN